MMFGVMRGCWFTDIVKIPMHRFTVIVKQEWA